MPFLLSIDHNDDGTTRIQYDDGPTRRVQFLTLTAAVQETLSVTPDRMLSLTLAEVRPPARRRSRQ